MAKVIPEETSTMFSELESILQLLEKPYKNWIPDLTEYNFYAAFQADVVPKITPYALIAKRNLAQLARLLARHSCADGRIGSFAISE